MTNRKLLLGFGLGAGLVILMKMTSKKEAPEPPASVKTALEAASKKYSVPYQVLKSVAWVESNYKQSSVSSVGAIGIMQLMPATAESLGVDPYDAAQNIMGGAKFLSALYKKYGDWNKAFAAYNWGPGNVDKNITWPSSVSSYVKKVNSLIA
jgi:soluble lytic murein transglycosylase-like protein